jgi:dihydroneopterin aldolase
MEAHETSPEQRVEVEIRGLSVYTHHGVSSAERELGQRLVLDVAFEVPDCDAVLTDRVEDTVDYGSVSTFVADVATERSYKTLERLCHVIGERIEQHYAASAVRVRAAKPEPPIEVAVGEVAVEVTREPDSDEADDELEAEER